MTFRVHKVVSSLPGTLEADAIYAVRTGVGFDLFITDSTGSIAHRVNRQDQVHVGTSPPASPSAGDLWVDTN